MDLDDISSITASALRLGRGRTTYAPKTTAPEPLTLYDFESCPFCRKAREALSELDLDYIEIPCGRGSRHRSELVERGGKAQFPYLVDPNTGQEMYESQDVVDYLHATYGTARLAAARALAPLDMLSSAMASATRGPTRATPGQRSTPELELYNYEACPHCRRVREVLVELDLRYTVRNVPRNGGRRSALVELGGKMQVPYLIDHTAGVSMYESRDIISHLRMHYTPS